MYPFQEGPVFPGGAFSYSSEIGPPGSANTMRVPTVRTLGNIRTYPISIFFNWRCTA